MTDEQGYNGWKNYETWSVALVVDNDESTYNERRDLVRGVASHAETSSQVLDGIWTLEQARRFMVADALKDWITYQAPELDEQYGPLCYLWSQLLSAALDEVDWDEIATNWLEDYAEAES